MEMERRMSTLINISPEKLQSKNEINSQKQEIQFVVPEIVRRRSSMRRRAPSLIFKMRNKDMNTTPKQDENPICGHEHDH